MKGSSEVTAGGDGRFLIRIDKARLIEEGADKVILAVEPEAVLHFLRETLDLWEDLFGAVRGGSR